MATETLQFCLDEKQLQQFQEEGYLVVERLFTDAKLQPVIDEISADLDKRCRMAVAEGRLSRTYEEYDFEHRLVHVNRENKEIAKSMWATHVVLPSFFGLMTNPKLLDVAEQICGPELIADGANMTRVVATAVDERGTTVPTEDRRIFIVVNDGGFIGENPVHLEGGRIAFYVQSREGWTLPITIRVTADGLEPCPTLEVKVQPRKNSLVPLSDFDAGGFATFH